MLFASEMACLASDHIQVTSSTPLSSGRLYETTQIVPNLKLFKLELLKQRNLMQRRFSQKSALFFPLCFGLYDYSEGIAQPSHLVVMEDSERERHVSVCQCSSASTSHSSIMSL